MNKSFSESFGSFNERNEQIDSEKDSYCQRISTQIICQDMQNRSPYTWSQLLNIYSLLFKTFQVFN